MSERVNKTLIYLPFLILSIIWAYFMEDDTEALSKLNTLNIEEAWNLACACYMTMNPRIGEFFYFLSDSLICYKTTMMTLHPIMVMLFIISCFKLATGLWPRKDKTKITFTIFIFTFVSIFSLIQTDWYLANYNWFYPCCAAMLFFSINEQIFKGNFYLSFWKLIISIPLATIVGMSNENTSIVSFFVYTACGIYYIFISKNKKSKLTASYILIWIILLSAVIAFYSSPARNVRAEYMHWEMNPIFLLENSILAWKNWAFFILHFWRHFAILAIFYLLIPHEAKSCNSRDKLLFTFFILLWGVLFLAPIWGAPRSFVPLEIILVIYTTRLIYKGMRNWHIKRLITGFCLSMIVISTIAIPRFYTLMTIHSNHLAIKRHCEESAYKGKEIVYIKSDILNFNPLISNKTVIPNFVFNGKCKAFTPLICAPHHIEEGNINTSYHLPMTDSWSTDIHHDAFLNRAYAKRLGVKAIIFEK